MNTSTDNSTPSTETPAVLASAEHEGDHTAAVLTGGPPEQDPFRKPEPSVRMLYADYEHENGNPRTDAEQAEWDSYVRRLDEYEKRFSPLAIVDLAEVMRNGVTEPEMLTENIVRGEYHLIFGTKESGKTWLVLLDVVELLQRGETVIWIDKEMGKKDIADRLLSIGAEPDDVEEHLLYMEFPPMDCSPSSKAAWGLKLDEKQPALVVVDAQTEVLADADLNENSGTDIEKWAQAYCTPARRIGAAVLMVDHIGHTETGRGVGSRQKGAAAKVELSVEKKKPFGREEVGQITVERKKNTVSAPIPERRSWRIGGERGKFIFEEIDSGEDSKSEENAERTRKIEEAILAVLQKQGKQISQTQLVALVGRKKLDVVRAAQQMALSDLSPVRMEPFGNSLRYSLAEPEAPDAG